MVGGSWGWLPLDVISCGLFFNYWLLWDSGTSKNGVDKHWVPGAVHGCCQLFSYRFLIDSRSSKNYVGKTLEYAYTGNYIWLGAAEAGFHQLSPAVASFFIICCRESVEHLKSSFFNGSNQVLVRYSKPIWTSCRIMHEGPVIVDGGRCCTSAIYMERGC